MKEKQKLNIRIETTLKKYPPDTRPEDIDSGRAKPYEITRKVVKEDADDRYIS